MDPDFDRFLPQPDLDENHFPQCVAQYGEEPCTCDTIERETRENYADMRAEMRLDMERFG